MISQGESPLVSRRSGFTELLCIKSAATPLSRHGHGRHRGCHGGDSLSWGRCEIDCGLGLSLRTILYYVDNPLAVADPTATDARAKFLRASRLRSAREGSAPVRPANA